MKPANIWCIGRNYLDHAKELGNKPPESHPIVFLKAGSSLQQGSLLRWDPWISEVHHEVELALVFGPNLEIAAGAIALDLTDRPTQNDLKSKSLPWTLAKSFRGACVVGKQFPISDLDAVSRWEVSLSINGQTRQHGQIKDMIFDCKTLAAYVQKHFPVLPGDLLLTGTPSGVGPLRSGDRLLAKIWNHSEEWTCS